MRFYLPEGGLGDGIALTATIREYHRKFPQEPIFVSTSHRYDGIYENNPHLSKSPSGSKVVVLETEKYNEMGNIAVSFGIQAGIEVVDNTPEIHLVGEDHKSAAPYVPPSRFVCVDPWARAPTRRWKWDRWVEVVNELRKKFFVIGIGKREPDYTHGKRDLRSLPVDLDLTGKIGVRTSAALLSKAALFVGMDSGGVHMAAAVGCPQVCIYSRSIWSSRAYWNTVPVQLALRPCAGVLCDRTCGNPFGFCLDNLHADRVLETIELALRRHPHGAHQKASEESRQNRRHPALAYRESGIGGEGLRRDDDERPELGVGVRPSDRPASDPSRGPGGNGASSQDSGGTTRRIIRTPAY